MFGLDNPVADDDKKTRSCLHALSDVVAWNVIS